MNEPDNRVIKSFVFHDGKCFFVSTIERESSAAVAPGRYNETIVWEYDWATATRGELIHSGEAAKGSLREHFSICAHIHSTGEPKEQERT